ncbi:MAG: hypothetical protein ACUVTN_10125 [Thermodesulfobacteriota bacterium]
MIPISIRWDTQRKRLAIYWNGFWSIEWEEGRGSVKVFRIPLPVRMKRKKFYDLRFLLRMKYLKEILSFLKDWKIKRIEVSVSPHDPMMSGVLYGCSVLLQPWMKEKMIQGTVNFLGQNWFRGEVILSLKDGIDHLRKWILPLLLEMRRREKRKEEIDRGGNRSN